MGDEHCINVGHNAVNCSVAKLPRADWCEPCLRFMPSRRSPDTSERQVAWPAFEAGFLAGRKPSGVTVQERFERYLASRGRQ